MRQSLLQRFKTWRAQRRAANAAWQEQVAAECADNSAFDKRGSGQGAEGYAGICSGLSGDVGRCHKSYVRGAR